MKDIVWYPLSGSQEVSYRLGFNDEYTNNKDCGVCCQEVYDIAWEALKEMVKLWKIKYNDRMPHDEELNSSWQYDYLEHPFRNLVEWDNVVAKAHLDISEFYKKHLNRFPSRDESQAAFVNCQINPYFKFDYTLIHETDENYKINHKNRYRDGKFEFCEAVEIDKCVFCGEPIYTFDKPFDNCLLKNAGIITMKFGYGSQRDGQYGEGYIHDLCSAKLDKVLFKKKLLWNSAFSNNLCGDDLI